MTEQKDRLSLITTASAEEGGYSDEEIDQLATLDPAEDYRLTLIRSLAWEVRRLRPAVHLIQVKFDSHADIEER